MNPDDTPSEAPAWFYTDDYALPIGWMVPMPDGSLQFLPEEDDE